MRCRARSARYEWCSGRARDPRIARMITGADHQDSPLLRHACHRGSVSLLVRVAFTFHVLVHRRPGITPRLILDR